MTRILLYIDQYPSDLWVDTLQQMDPTLDVRVYPDWGTPDEEPAYVICWNPKHGLLKEYPNIKAIFSLGAGIDHLTADPGLPKDIPIIRMGDDGLKEGMQEFMVMGVLMLHRGMLQVIADNQSATWGPFFAASAAEKTVGIMGYGALGQSVAQRLIPFGYKITTWSNSAKPAENGVTHFCGATMLDDFLAATDYFVCLLPNTPETTDLINADTIAKMPKGAGIINGGRGNLIKDEDLLAALDSDHLSGAILDVFKSEPLDKDHPYWSHKKVIVTPHIAAVTRLKSGASYILENLYKIKAGKTPDNLLDLKRGY